MLNQELAPQNLFVSNKEAIAKQLLLKLLSKLPKGNMLIREDGQLIGKFGNTSQDQLSAEIDIKDARFYTEILLNGSIGAGETYVEGYWKTPCLTSVIRIFAQNLPTIDKLEGYFGWMSKPFALLKHWRNRNSQQQAKRNISAHYDIGNNLYKSFLDETMMYSAAIYPSQQATLEQAQRHKLDLICKKLKLTAEDHLLEIGTGWGGLALHAATQYGCKVTTTTISDEQYQWVKERIDALGLDGQITLLKQDYRELTGSYNKLVSIEMIEAVGKRYLSGFFRKCNQLLSNDGLMLIQSITIDDRRYDTYSKGVDFIQKHIFPGGFLPSNLVLAHHVKHDSDLVIRDSHDIGLDYAYTLQAWWKNLSKNRSKLCKLGYDDRFMRLWQFYFSYCEGGFIERTISTVQLVLTKPDHNEALFNR